MNEKDLEEGSTLKRVLVLAAVGTVYMNSWSNAAKVRYRR
jgi:hypothetical protein